MLENELEEEDPVPEQQEAQKGMSEIEDVAGQQIRYLNQDQVEPKQVSKATNR